jgi:flagellin
LNIKFQGGIIMGLRISTNVQSIAARRTLSKNNTEQASTLGKLSSGSRIVNASDDAAGLAISEKLKAGIRSTNQAERNANDGISLVQTAEGGLSEVSNILVRLRELAIQSSSDTIGDTEREFSNMEYQSLKQEVERISQVTEFNGKKLLNGEAEKYEFQIGTKNDEFNDRISFDGQVVNSSTENLGIEGLEVSTKESARETLDQIDNAITTVSGQRAELGATQNRLTSTVSNLQVSSENLSAANSRIRDTDYAAETAKNAKLSILTNAGTSVLSQSNSMGASALKLIG